MIHRHALSDKIATALERSRVVGLLGPRQCGKTTMARQFVSVDSANYFDLENPRDLERLTQAQTALEPLRGLVVIDEIQRRPDLFPILRVLADRESLPARFLILGSASPSLLRQSSESLAGRMSRIEMTGFSLAEVGPEGHPQHWLRGGFPLSFLAADEAASAAWRQDFLSTFLERDIPQLGFSTPATTLLRFWTMLAHCSGQTWNASELARSMGMSQPSIRGYLDLLTDLYMVRQLPAWHANLKKRQVKAPKVYLRDTGLLHSLLGIRSEKDLLTHPKMGASWEGYVIEEVLRSVEPDESFFWATHQGAEIDLIMIKDGRMLGVECKRVDAPKMTASMKIALQDLGLERISVVYPGSLRYPISPQIEAVPLREAILGMEGLYPNQ